MTAMFKAEERARRIEANVSALIARNASDDGLRRTNATHEDWDPIRVLAHVAEFLPYWAAQAKDVAERRSNGQPFGRTHTDPARIAAIEDHAHDELAPTVARLRSALAGSVALLRSIPDDAWTKTGTHARRGEMTIEQVVDQLMCDHLLEHLTQADALKV